MSCSCNRRWIPPALPALIAASLLSAADDTQVDRAKLREALGKVRTTLPEVVQTIAGHAPGGIIAALEIVPAAQGPLYVCSILTDKDLTGLTIDAQTGKASPKPIEPAAQFSTERAAALRRAFKDARTSLVQAVALAERRAEGGTFFHAEAAVQGDTPVYRIRVIRSELVSLVTIGLTTGTFLESDAPGPAAERTWNFDRDRADSLSAGWSIRHTDPGETPAEWKVVADPGAPSRPNAMGLVKTESAGSTFNLLLAEGTSYGDIDLSVRIKAVSGKEDQGGGLVWRAKDENNYYICRFNPLEGNFRVYKVVKGKRRQLETAKVETEAGRWYEVRVRMAGEKITCWLDGKQWLEATDGDFKEPGMIGFWTKADAACLFDDLRVERGGNQAATPSATGTGRNR